MATAQQDFTLVRINKSSWAAIYTGGVDAHDNPASTILPTNTPSSTRTFAESVPRASFFASHPRIRTLLLALALVAVTATVVLVVGATFETEFLRLGGMVVQ